MGSKAGTEKRWVALKKDALKSGLTLSGVFEQAGVNKDLLGDDGSERRTLVSLTRADQQALRKSGSVRVEKYTVEPT